MGGRMKIILNFRTEQVEDVEEFGYGGMDSGHYKASLTAGLWGNFRQQKQIIEKGASAKDVKQKEREKEGRGFA